MRKSREEAAQTRKRIVTAASEEFRKNGIVATGLNDLMSAAGLTHGGFYKHFESKDQLVAEATVMPLGFQQFVLQAFDDDLELGDLDGCGLDDQVIHLADLGGVAGVEMAYPTAFGGAQIDAAEYAGIWL